ncbi:MAG: hypothetical protein PHW63_10395 [Alphaproteobacteria bacterium]|nr:hypothetical protein [Alphaproteobacteria bacterium]
MPVLFRFVTCLIVTTLIAGAPCAWASGGGGGHGGSGGGEAKKEKADENKKKRREASTITGGESETDPIYLHLAPITFPVIDDNGAQQIVTMLVDLQTPDRAKAEAMQNSMPKLKDALLQALYGGMADGSMRNAYMLDVAKVKASVIETINRVFGADHVKDAFVQAVSQRKL